MENVIKIVAIISMFTSFAGILYSAKNWIELMENILPEKKWLYINPFLIFRKSYLTDDGEKIRNRVVRGLAVFIVGMLLFFTMYGLHHSLENN